METTNVDINSGLNDFDIDYAEKMNQKGIRHLEVKDENGLCHYQGDLGDFVYDPKLFQVQKIKIPDNESKYSSVEILRYIGTETDGSKIEIPSGLENAQFMFMNTDIKSTPELPSSIKRTDGMFLGCKSLVTADIKFPPSLESAPFMFANCSKLENGPLLIPGTIKDANMMFVNNENLKNAPKIGEGVESAELMFGNCKKLTDFPNIPQSMKDYQHMTFGCDELDKTKDAEMKKKLEADRVKFVKKMDQPTFRQRCASAFSAIMQIHAMRQAGWGVLEAPFLVNQYRKNGVFSKDFAGGMSALAMSGKGGMMMNILAAKSAKNAQKRDMKLAEQKKERLEKWDKTHGYGSGTHQDLQMLAQVRKDVAKGVLKKLPLKSSEERNMYGKQYSMSAKFREDGINQILNWNGSLSLKDKKTFANMYLNDLSAISVYYQEGLNVIEKSDLSKKDKAMAIRGLEQMSSLQAEPLMDSIERVQSQYKIFNDGDLRQIYKFSKMLPSEKAKSTSFLSRTGLDTSATSSYRRTMDTFNSLEKQMKQQAGGLSEDLKMDDSESVYSV